MHIELEQSPDKNLISSYSEGEIKIRQQTYQKNVIISAKTVDTWSVETFQTLTLEDCELLLTYKPDLIIIGTGSKPGFLKPELTAFFQKRGVGIEVMNTQAACRTFNVLLSEERNVLGAFVI